MRGRQKALLHEGGGGKQNTVDMLLAYLNSIYYIYIYIYIYILYIYTFYYIIYIDNMNG